MLSLDRHQPASPSNQEAVTQVFDATLQTLDDLEILSIKKYFFHIDNNIKYEIKGFSKNTKPNPNLVISNHNLWFTVYILKLLISNYRMFAYLRAENVTNEVTLCLKNNLHRLISYNLLFNLEIIKGYISRITSFDFDLFLLKPDLNDDGGIFFRYLFSNFQTFLEALDIFPDFFTNIPLFFGELNKNEIDMYYRIKELKKIFNNETFSEQNMDNHSKYFNFRQHKILFSMRHLIHFAYSHQLSESEIIMFMQYATMLMNIASWEVSCNFIKMREKIKILIELDQKIKTYDTNIELWDAIFMILEFITQNKKMIINIITSYIEKKVTVKLIKIFEKFHRLGLPDLPDYAKDELEVKDVENFAHDYICRLNISSDKSTEHFVPLLDVMCEYNFMKNILTLLDKPDLFQFTVHFTHFYQIMDNVIYCYKYDNDFFAHSPTFIKIFGLFFSYSNNVKPKRPQDKIFPESHTEYRNLLHKVEAFLTTAYFGDKMNDFRGILISPIIKKFIEKKKEELDDSYVSLHSTRVFMDTVDIFIRSPMSIGEKNVNSKLPIIQTVFGTLSNQLSSWCKQYTVDETAKMDSPMVLLELIRQWTAHQYEIYVQCGISANEATKMAVYLNAFDSSAYQNDSAEQNHYNTLGYETNDISENNITNSPNSVVDNKNTNNKIINIGKVDLSYTKTFRVIFHYESFFRNTIQDDILKVRFVRELKEFINLDNNKTHPFLNFQTLYELATIVGPEGMKLISGSVVREIFVQMQTLWNTFIIIAKTVQRKKKNITILDDIVTVLTHADEVTEIFAKIGNIIFLKSIIKESVQALVRDRHPKMFFVLRTEEFGIKENQKKFQLMPEDFNMFEISEDLNITQILFDELSKKKEFDFVSKTCIYLPLITISSPYFLENDKQTASHKSPKKLISDLAIIRGIDELYSLIRYNWNKIDENESKHQKKMLADVYKYLFDQLRKENDVKSNVAKFIYQFFKVSTVFSQNYYADVLGDTSNDPPVSFNGRRATRNVVGDSLLISTLEWESNI